MSRMIEKQEIDKILKKYDRRRLTIATICSHSALQIFFGAKQEGFRTLGICRPQEKKIYDSFELAKPDEYLMVEDYSQVLQEKTQNAIKRKNAVVIPHGSFVEYVGGKNIEEKFLVPMFGNRGLLEWESNRQKEKLWLERAGLEVPNVFKPAEIDKLCIVKYWGAKGGRGMFLASSRREFERKLRDQIINKVITKEEAKNFFIQEYVIGLRYYPHYFYSPLLKRVELLGIDRRDESNIDSLHRLALSREEVDRIATYIVTGNLPLVVRERLLAQLIEMGERVVEASFKLTPGGMVGPFCLETICRDDMRFVTFEISARIVAGTNLYPLGSPYSCYLFEEPMSTGRRIAREVKLGIKQNKLEKVIY